MDSSRTPEEPCRPQQTLDNALASTESRNEVILRWDPHGKFLRFNDGNQLVEHLMVNYSKAKRAHENRDGGLNGILEPHQTLTIAGTEDDEKTLARGRYDVVDFLADIDREVRYVPDYGWTYSGMRPDDLYNIVDTYVDRVEWLYEEAAAMGLDHVEFIPLAKGLNTEHYRWAAETYQQLGVDRIAMYGVQTRSMPTFVRRVEQAANVFDPTGILVIGKQSPNDVADLPALVDGVAGLWNWKEACNLTADGYSSEYFTTWFYNVKDALRTGHTTAQTGLPTEVRTDGRGR